MTMILLETALDLHNQAEPWQATADTDSLTILIASLLLAFIAFIILMRVRFSDQRSQRLKPISSWSSGGGSSARRRGCRSSPHDLAMRTRRPIASVERKRSHACGQIGRLRVDGQAMRHSIEQIMLDDNSPCAIAPRHARLTVNLVQQDAGFVDLVYIKPLLDQGQRIRGCDHAILAPMPDGNFRPPLLPRRCPAYQIS